MKECEVLIQIDMKKIPFEKIKIIEDAFHKANIHFDTGAGMGFRDWEFDWSLKGPIKIYFKRFIEDGAKIEKKNSDS
jgi:hypothetical protein